MAYSLVLGRRFGPTIICLEMQGVYGLDHHSRVARDNHAAGTFLVTTAPAPTRLLRPP